LFDWAPGKPRSALKAKPLGMIVFESKEEAKKLIGLMVAHAQKRLQGLLIPAQQEMIQQVEQKRSELMQRLKQETDPIVNRARVRLNVLSLLIFVCHHPR
jgi:hypothetical protein